MNETQPTAASEQEIAGRLASYYRAACPGHRGARIRQLARISDGWETDVYAFTLDEGASRQELILRGYPGDDAVAKSAREFAVMKGLHVDDLEYFEVAMCLRRLFSIVVSLSAGADKLGMRPGAEAMMARNPGHIRRVYRLLRERTGIALPQVEQLLARLA